MNAINLIIAYSLKKHVVALTTKWKRIAVLIDIKCS